MTREKAERPSVLVWPSAERAAEPIDGAGDPQKGARDEHGGGEDWLRQHPGDGERKDAEMGDGARGKLRQVGCERTERRLGEDARLVAVEAADRLQDTEPGQQESDGAEGHAEVPAPLRAHDHEGNCQKGDAGQGGREPRTKAAPACGGRDARLWRAGRGRGLRRRRGASAVACGRRVLLRRSSALFRHGVSRHVLRISPPVAPARLIHRPAAVEPSLVLEVR